MAKKKETAEQADKKPNILFDTLIALFNNKEYISSLTPEAIKQNSFMINRRLAIKYPLQSQVFNNAKVNPQDVLYFWSDYLYNGAFAPKWIYTAGAKKSQEKKDAKKEVSASQIKAYCLHKGYSIKDFADALRFFPEEAVAEIKDFECYKKAIQSETEY